MHRDIHWGHVVRRNLIHWEHLPIALAPEPGTPDEAGVWSGCAVDADGTPVAIYTGVGGASRRDQHVCVAFGDSTLRTLAKHPGNPVIAGGPPGVELVRGASGTVEFPRSCVWREADGWYLAIGAGITGVGGTALLYRSPDLLTWEYLHPLCVGDASRREPHWTGIMWEMRRFLPLGEQHVLMFSAWDGAANAVVHMIGNYADTASRPSARRSPTMAAGMRRNRSRTSRGGGSTGAGSARGARSRRRSLPGGRARWRCPASVTLTPAGDLSATPAPEMASLRRAHRQFAGRQIAPSSIDKLDGASGAYLELLATLDPGDAERCGLLIRRSPGGEEETRIAYDQISGTITLDRFRSTLDPDQRSHQPDDARAP